MKLINIMTSTLLVLGLSTVAYAEMGKCGAGKCGTGMEMKGDFATNKAMMLKRINKMKSCIESSKSKNDIKTCKMEMMQKGDAKSDNKSMKCGAGKCGNGK